MKGSTLIETLIYIALLSLLMLGMFSSVFMFTDSKNNKTGTQKDLDNQLLLKNYFY